MTDKRNESEMKTADNGVRYRASDGVARATLSRPDARNALHAPALKALARAVASAAADESVRVLALDGAGKNFCAGADINWMRSAGGGTNNLADAKRLSDLLLAIRNLPKPVVVFAHGVCAGGGAGLCAAADICVAHRDAVFSFREVRLGIIPATIAPYVVGRIGAGAARRLFVSGEPVGADEAARLGLIDKIAKSESPEDARSEALKDAARLRECGPEAMAAAKKLVAEVASRPINKTLADETAQVLASVRATPEAREGLSAFLEKRRPDWAPESPTPVQPRPGSNPDPDSGGKESAG